MFRKEGKKPNQTDMQLQIASPQGLLKVRIIRGVNLAIKDLRSSDPYVVVRMGKDRYSCLLEFLKLKTRVIKKNVNPEWNEELTLSVTDPVQPIKLAVYDKDTFSFDDPMGDAEIDIKPFVEAAQTSHGLPDGSVVKKLQPCRQNCYAEESCIYYMNGRVHQDAIIRLRNVECGELEVQLRWVNLNSNRA